MLAVLIGLTALGAAVFLAVIPRPAPRPQRGAGQLPESWGSE